MDIKTILQEKESTIIVEKSKFISFIYPVKTKKEIEEKLLFLREKYHDATHICYGYIVLEENVVFYKSSDDGEPSSSAGAPILNVLRKNNLLNVLCVVIRYFGGIKLGVGGLTRTYSNSALGVLNQTQIVTLVDAYYYEFIFNYDQIKEMDKVFLNNRIVISKKDYDNEVHYFAIFEDLQMAEMFINKINYLNIVIKYKGIIQMTKKC